MDSIVGILKSLGADYTFSYQLGIFVVVFVIMKKMVFEPYLEAFLQRQAQTTGSHEDAEKITAKAKELETVYQSKARDLNLNIKSTFDSERQKAQAEHEKIVLVARDKAKEVLDSSRKTIEQEFARAREELLRDTKPMGEALASRLIVKE